jgi:ERCC4-type nuclease
MIVIDVGEPPEVFEMFEEKGIPYIRSEIRFSYCKDCEKAYNTAKEVCDCGSDNMRIERVGDFTNTDRTWVIERKTETDFVGSMLDKSIHSQAARMAKYYAGWKFVLLEGFITVMVDDPHHKGRMIPWIKSMRVELRKYDICMWQCDDLAMLVDEVFRIEKNAGDQPRIYEKINDKYKGWSDAKQIVCKLIDISDKKADVLLSAFGDPLSIFHAIMDSIVLYTRTGNPKGITGALSEIKGFGPKFITKNQRLLEGE